MPVKKAPWNLLNKVPKLPGCLECLSSFGARAPQVPKRLKWLECPSVLSVRMPNCLQIAYSLLRECPNVTKF